MHWLMIAKKETLVAYDTWPTYYLAKKLTQASSNERAGNQNPLRVG